MSERRTKIDPDELPDEDEMVGEVDLEAEEDEDIDVALRDAVAAVEEVENRAAVVEEPGVELDEAELLRREIDELRERSVRTLADFDNFRKRTERERQDLLRFALIEPMREMLAVVDNLERALGAEGSTDDLKTGVELILRQMHDLLKRQGVREVVAEGATFDPAVHDAVARREEAGIKEPRVVRELQRGYQLHDRLLRPAIVEVAVPAENDGDEES